VKRAFAIALAFAVFAACSSTDTTGASMSSKGGRVYAGARVALESTGRAFVAALQKDSIQAIRCVDVKCSTMTTYSIADAVESSTTFLLYSDSTAPPSIVFRRAGEDSLVVSTCDDDRCSRRHETVIQTTYSTVPVALLRENGHLQIIVRQPSPWVPDVTSGNIGSSGGIASSKYDLTRILCMNRDCSRRSASDFVKSVGADTIVITAGDRVWVIGTDDDGALAFRRCRDTCSAPTNVMDVQPTRRIVAAAGGDDGLPLILSLTPHRTDTSNDELRLVRCSDPSCTAVESSVIRRGTTAFAQVRRHADSRAIVAFDDQEAETVVLVRCSDVGCANTEMEQIARGTLLAFDVQASGVSVIVWLDPVGVFWLTRCVDRECGDRVDRRLAIQ
jgi:hypothetical protein